jgi:gliding motility-associated-like protein
MKKLVLLFFLSFFSYEIFASHIAGATIYYDPISSNQYRVTLVLYRDCSGITLGITSAPITWRSRCGQQGTFNVNLQSTGSTNRALPDECKLNLPPTTCEGGTRYGLEKFVFSGIWTVPNNVPFNCRQFVFGHQVQCCRNTNATTNSGDAYVESYLNDTLVPKNSNARSQNFYLPGYCAGQPIEFDLGPFDPDRDSLSFYMIPAKTGPGAFNTNATGVNVLYNAGRTFQAPIALQPGTNIRIDSTRGIMYITPTPAIQIGIFAFMVQDWRLTKVDSATGQKTWVLAGTNNLDLQYYFQNTPAYCDNVRPNFRPNNFTVDCFTDSIALTFNVDVTCNTVTTDATEFRLLAPSNQQIPMLWAQPILCNQISSPGIFKTRNMLLKFRNPLSRNGVYKLYVKKGRDGDTFGNKCKKFMNEFDTIRIVVNNCYEYNDPQDLLNVTVDSITNKGVYVEWADPSAALDYNYFKSFNIYKKAAASDPWSLIHEEKNPAVRTFKDNDINVDKDTALYTITVTLKTGVETPINDSIYNIHFTYDPNNVPDEFKANISWNQYIGWNTPSYTVQISPEFTPPAFTTTSPVINTTSLGDSLVKPLEAGKYLVRVISDQVGGAQKRTYSNWAGFEVPVRQLKTYNVITPNGDGANDLFEIDGLQFWPRTKLTIYNRWGQAVYKSEDYRNDWGTDAAEGTYFYLVEPSNGKNLQGVLKVVK